VFLSAAAITLHGEIAAAMRQAIAIAGLWRATGKRRKMD